MALYSKCEDRLGALASMNDARLSICQLLMDVDMIRKIQPDEQSSSSIESTLKRVHS